MAASIGSSYKSCRDRYHNLNLAVPCLLLRCASLPTRWFYLDTRKQLFSKHRLQELVYSACIWLINECPPRIDAIIDPVLTPLGACFQKCLRKLCFLRQRIC